ncbi:MAG: metal-dependent hydrolase, partial [Thiohalocapsa sp.]
SLLPDIDADDSKPLRAVFDIAGLVVGFLVAFAFAGRFGVLELVGIWAGTWALVRWPVRYAFARFTVHRGIWHSLLMAGVVALAAALAADLWLRLAAPLAWLVAGFVLLGFITHLVLDEVASVDLLGRQVKRSFGTALKPCSIRAWPASLALAGLAVLLAGLAPDPEPLLSLLGRAGVDTGLLAVHWPRW